MRIMGFSKRWAKLQQPRFTTFRVTRKNKDWFISEIVQIVYKPRSPHREILGKAQIINKETRLVPYGTGNQSSIRRITEDEAKADGFVSLFEMKEFLRGKHGDDKLKDEPINKLTLIWLGNKT